MKQQATFDPSPRLARPPAFLEDGDGGVNPLAGMANLFDVAMVFAVALMVALVSYLQLPALLQGEDYTVITNPGRPDMEIIVKEGKEIKHYEATNEIGVGQGELLGKAYRLPDGRVVYVPAEKQRGLSAERPTRNAKVNDPPAQPIEQTGKP
ncbi:MAG TPA: DUF2149 domain-containing protein [Planctomycetaceae bacterium]|nr:DUF2149 domain-containing protein [Planctomycetaceae bacterium]HIQ22303.1 DUF2149 domain-containing protein [Planctomycetota bacterium]